MSRLRILVESDGETIVDIDDEVEHWAVDIENRPIDVGTEHGFLQRVDVGTRRVKVDYALDLRVPKPERIAL